MSGNASPIAELRSSAIAPKMSDEVYGRSRAEERAKRRRRGQRFPRELRRGRRAQRGVAVSQLRTTRTSGSSRRRLRTTLLEAA